MTDADLLQRMSATEAEGRKLRDQYGESVRLRIGAAPSLLGGEPTMHGTYGPVTPPLRTPLGGLMGTGPGIPASNRPVTDRLSDLTTQVAETGKILEDARERRRDAVRYETNAEGTFAKAVDALERAINELREGVPEGVPYGGLPPGVPNPS